MSSLPLSSRLDGSVVVYILFRDGSSLGTPHPMFCGLSPQFDPSEKLAYILCDIIWIILRHTNYILLGHNLKMVRINQIGGAPGTIRLDTHSAVSLVSVTGVAVSTLSNAVLVVEENHCMFV